MLNKHFAPHQFNVRYMNGREPLIRRTPELLEQFRNAHYDGLFILADKDKERCLTELRALFNQAEQDAFRLPRAERYLNLCAPIRNVEAWYQADEAGIRLAIPGTTYVVPAETDGKGKGTIKQLLTALYGNRVAYNEIDFANAMAPLFDPAAARLHSTSFNYFWTRLEEVTA
ncbi:MAG: DUF4276 family protein [Flavobacteriales bacterium]|nr:DUF4276 family protein [Flavobacteriales bacterium]